MRWGRALRRMPLCQHPKSSKRSETRRERVIGLLLKSRVRLKWSSQTLTIHIKSKSEAQLNSRGTLLSRRLRMMPQIPFRKLSRKSSLSTTVWTAHLSQSVQLHRKSWLRTFRTYTLTRWDAPSTWLLSRQEQKSRPTDLASRSESSRSKLKSNSFNVKWQKASIQIVSAMRILSNLGQHW